MAFSLKKQNTMMSMTEPPSKEMRFDECEIEVNHSLNREVCQPSNQQFPEPSTINFISPSEARLKHVVDLYTTDILKANTCGNQERLRVNRGAQKPRNQPIPAQNHFLATDPEKFDDRAKASLIAALAKNPTAKSWRHIEQHIVVFKIQQDRASDQIIITEFFHARKVEFTGYLNQSGEWILNNLEHRSIVKETTNPAFQRQQVDFINKNPLPRIPFHQADDI